ncbi:MAG: amidase [Ktedonobacteraceae bacterium]
MSSTPLTTFATATEMLHALRTKHISAIELLDVHLQHIERYNPAINAIITPDYERARQTAQEADAARARGEERPLLGLPLTIKDCLDVQDLPTTAGIRARAHALAKTDGLISARVRAAGGVIMGKTNIPPYASEWQANNKLFGRTNNPWDLTRSPGGSTGGGAAALAAGLTPLELGSDIGGSIRIPAAFCGCYGHKPSESAIPHSGHFPGSPLPNPALVMSVQGPLARSVTDLELAFDVIAGPDIGEETAWHLHIPPARHERLSEYRVAVLPPLPWVPIERAILEARETLLDHLRRVGAKVVEIQPEAFGDWRAYYTLYYQLLLIMVWLDVPLQTRQAAAQTACLSADEFVVAGACGLTASATDYIAWLAQREQYRAVYREFFRTWDILLAPVSIVNAFPHIDLSIPFTERTLDVDGQQVAYPRMSAYPALATLCGQPATAFPVGQTRSGLPIGLQAIGPYLEDRTTLRFAELVEREFGGFRCPPAYREK